MRNIANIIIIKIKNIAQRLKIKSPFQFFAVMMVFSVTGSLSLILSRPILIFFGLDPEITNIYFFWFLRIIILFFVYQFLLIVVAFLFGQFTYFWEIEKKMLRRFGIKL